MFEYLETDQEPLIETVPQLLSSICITIDSDTGRELQDLVI
jgi:hypothetical protein